MALGLVLIFEPIVAIHTVVLLFILMSSEGGERKAVLAVELFDKGIAKIVNGSRGVRRRKEEGGMNAWTDDLAGL